MKPKPNYTRVPPVTVQKTYLQTECNRRISMNRQQL